MTLDAHSYSGRDRRALEAFSEELREIYGGVLLAAAVTGEAAGPSYRPNRTPLQTVVFVERVTAAVLRAARPSLRRWSRKRIPTPLFLDPAYVAGAYDTFPLEFSEMADGHVLLCGDAELFRAVRIESAPLRLQVEEQLRGKLLHLWEHYLVSGGRRDSLERLLLDTLPSFEVPLRGLLRWLRMERGEAPTAPQTGVPLIDAVAESLQLELPTLRRLQAARLDERTLDDDELDPVFEAFLDEVRSVAVRIDRGL